MTAFLTCFSKKTLKNPSPAQVEHEDKNTVPRLAAFGHKVRQESGQTKNT